MGLVLLVSLVFQMEVPLIIDHKRFDSMKFCPHLLQVQAFYERQAHDVELEAWPANLGSEKSFVQEKTGKAITYWAKAVINFKVCEVHSLLLSCPVWLHTPLRLITARVNLNQYRYKLPQG